MPNFKNTLKKRNNNLQKYKYNVSKKTRYSIKHKSHTKKINNYNLKGGGDSFTATYIVKKGLLQIYDIKQTFNTNKDHETILLDRKASDVFKNNIISKEFIKLKLINIKLTIDKYSYNKGKQIPPYTFNIFFYAKTAPTAPTKYRLCTIVMTCTRTGVIFKNIVCTNTSTAIDTKFDTNLAEITKLFPNNKQLVLEIACTSFASQYINITHLSV